MLGPRSSTAAVGGPSLGVRGPVAVAVVVSVLVGPLPLVPVVGPSGGPLVAPVAAATCGAAVDAADVGADPVVVTAAVQAAIDGAASADPACAAWTVTLTGVLPLAADLVHADDVPLVLSGPEGDRAELVGAGVARVLTVRRPATTVTLRRLVVRGGRATGTDLGGAGGAVATEVPPRADPTPGRVEVVDAVLIRNEAAAGGAIAADEVVLTDVDLVANVAPLGGAVDAGTLTATRVQFVANDATSAPGQGGAVRASGDVTLETVTFLGNAAVTGGSVWISGSADPVLRATAVTFGSARADVGGHVTGDAGLGGSVRVVLRGTVLAGASALAPAGPDPDVCAGVVAHVGGGVDAAVASLATDASCPGAAALPAAPALTAVAGADGAVEGRTRLVLPAAAGPLVDVADCAGVWPATDARGVARPRPDGGRCDAGAVEVDPPLPPAAPTPDPAPSPAPSDTGPDAGPDPDPVVTPVPAAVRAGDAPAPSAGTGTWWREVLRRLRRR